ncbi:hypothetical protein [Halothiobacillus sp. DCM-1]|uniref:hypothetical protein n=1 Tax=Halothiobacillus sp. DCM-1 TaxID=3112558 RepID=UPI003247D092
MNDRKLLRNSGIALLLALLAGCATPPQYATHTQFVPPSTPAGQQCVAQCSTALSACQNQCAATRTACVANIEPAAKQAFEAALQQYEGARQQYERDRQQYDLNQNLRFGWGYGQPVFVPGYGWVFSPGYFGRGWEDNPPSPPRAPSLAEERARLIAERCDNAPCACQSNYEQCYQGCGGQVQKSVVCVAHCESLPPPPAAAAPTQP